MPLTPLDIQNKEFKRGFRGYSEEEVDEFLDELTRDYEAVLGESKGLRQELAKTQEELERYRSIKDTLNNTLVTAQQSAEEVRASARKEADLIIKEAQMRAAGLIEEAQGEVARIQKQHEATLKQVEYFRMKMRGFLKAQLEMFKEGANPGGLDETEDEDA